MKSIKEKEEEYVFGFHPSIQRICKESFEAGANYVLEEIEELLSLKKQYSDKDRFIDDLEWRILQLKK